ncbi:MAG: hypothetical protein A2845_00165 [Candidatus Lloydbacteria bacterium RIFCSPHIGHO2_01_FULL_49_22]|uniref:IPT/TIG domain-containing protein n=1 Tax=Candidatus Lloydbacteria bacterium RIFCSPHIGHO2_01_FULL_49_22 TaxID=1798658 RepID=A0A1G2CZZ1_9BACT|nr:MAG: hypothetical protein A2845_00165 [Candidatus Lloydbacteria bacterium RIFCSPHIGHO2_01_FULL_49_22]OGZ09282.1 MAG: hypothetical protein A3C14_05070 [Candidatus Lloydbacteria bacterium RIFCSPHIGHO2_02_FULL_50_18]
MMHMRTFIILLVSCFSLFTALPVFAATDCVTLSRNLSLGMSGTDVTLLQQVLNRDPRTNVAVTGPGSAGFESRYFGPLTKQAVVAFQNIYAGEVLSPVGLTTGSGYVGTFTRAKILTLCNKSQVAISTPITTPTPIPPNPVTPVAVVNQAPSTVAPSTATTNKSEVVNDTVASLAAFHSATPVMMFPSTYTASRGTKVLLYGVGLATEGNIVHLGDYLIASTSVDKLGVLTFIVPENAPRGKHDLWISSSKGATNKMFLIVTELNVPAPTIVSFSPAEGLLGTMVTVTGTGFTAQGNEVIGGQGFQKNIISADGKTLQFKVTAEVPGVEQGIDYSSVDARIPVWYGILNENGISKKLMFTVII